MYTTQIDHMNLHQIANSGQCFRWQQINDNTYKIPAFGRELTISQDGDLFNLSCDESEWHRLWKNYFDVDTDTDYDEAEKIIMESDDDFLKAAYRYGSGIRILRQDLWEVIVSFIISQNNNIPRIKKSIEKLCNEVGGRFPTCWEILDMDLSDKGLGYRDEYIRNACEWFKFYNKYYIAYQRNKNMQLYAQSYETMKNVFMNIKGVGSKVANCICLFAAHKLDAFPIDIHIQKILDREYNNRLPEWAESKYAGLFQQYLFYYELSHKH